MNKTFNDPNLKYSDQLTPLAQMAGFESGSSDLPAIEYGDAGKVLTVNAGETGAEWAAPSGGDSFIIGSTYNDSTGVETLNKTAQEIIDAITAGKICYVRNLEVDSSESWFSVKTISDAEWIATEASFYAYDIMNSVVKHYSCSALSDYPATVGE